MMITNESSVEAAPRKKQPLPGRASVALLVALLTAVAVSTHRAAADQEQAIVVAPEKVAPLRSLLEQLSGSYPGRVLEVELEREEHGREDIWVYEVKLLTNRGRVLKLEYDAVSLELLEMEGKPED